MNKNNCYDENLRIYFTAYLKRAVHNARIDYLYRKDPRLSEVLTDDIEQIPVEQADFESDVALNELIAQALSLITSRERYILFSRIFLEKSFGQLAEELGMSYKGVSAVYYRTINKLRKLIGDDSNE